MIRFEVTIGRRTIVNDGVDGAGFNIRLRPLANPPMRCERQCLHSDQTLGIDQAQITENHDAHVGPDLRGRRQ